MFEKEPNYNNDAYSSKLIEFSRFADAILLDKRRRELRERGVSEGVADIGFARDITSEFLTDYCIKNFVTPPTRAFVSILGDTGGDTVMSKRTLCLDVTSGDVDTLYMISCNIQQPGEIEVGKKKQRICGVPDFDRRGDLVPESALLEPVPCDSEISDLELEILYEVIMCVAD